MAGMRRTNHGRRFSRFMIMEGGESVALAGKYRRQFRNLPPFREVLPPSGARAQSVSWVTHPGIVCARRLQEADNMLVLVVNAGSSSLKAQLIETEGKIARMKCLAERVGSDGAVMTGFLRARFRQGRLQRRGP